MNIILWPGYAAEELIRAKAGFRISHPASARGALQRRQERVSSYIYIYIYIYEHSCDLRQASGSATQHPPEAPYRAAKKEKVLVHVIYIYI